MDTGPRVICGFPGVGKSTLFKKLKNSGFPILDSDSSTFDKANFPANYITHIKQALEEGFWVLCSTHTAVRAALAEAGISYALAAPTDRYLKDEYMQRYRERGSPEAFLKLMDEKFEEFVDDVWINDQHGVHIGLGEGEYLDRIERDLIKRHRGMERETFKSTNEYILDLTIGSPGESFEFLKGFYLGTMTSVLIQVASNRVPGDVSFLVRTGNTSTLMAIAMAVQMDLSIEETQNPQAQKATFSLRESSRLIPAVKR